MKAAAARLVARNTCFLLGFGAGAFLAALAAGILLAACPLPSPISPFVG